MNGGSIIKKNKTPYFVVVISLIAGILFTALELPEGLITQVLSSFSKLPSTSSAISLEYDGGYEELVINDNKPQFMQEDLALESGTWQTFSNLDYLNRVGQANAVIGQESYPTEAREQLTVTPTGWQQKKLPGNQWLYNRCHLIGFQLTGENNNMKNLMTGTRRFNTPHMLNYENQVKAYIDSTGEHVRYRVTPYFKDNELVARGIQLEAKSIESDRLEFNVFIYNVQEGYSIDYLTGRASKKK